MTPVSSLPVVLNGKVILHCKHIKEWNPALPGRLLCLCPSLEDLRLCLQLQLKPSWARLAHWPPSAACFCHTRPDDTHTDVTGLRHEPHTPVDACELTVANGNSVADAEPAGKRKPNTYEMRCQLWGGISTVFCGMLASSVFWKNANQCSLETPYIWHL